MEKIFLIIATFLSSLTAFGQGTIMNGLKTGFWTEKYKDASHIYTLKGNYKIIPLAQYDTIGGSGRNFYEVKYRGSTPLMFYNGKSMGKISVKDSVWNHYDQEGNLIKTDFWLEGLNQSTKYFDEKGNLMRYDYDDYENDTSFYLTYIDGQLFKKAFYPPENKNLQTEIFYPNDPLILSDAELIFIVNLLNKPIATEEIFINAKKDLLIESIYSQREFVKILTANNHTISFPLSIKANTPVPLKIIVSPSSANYVMTDTLTLFTSDKQAPYYIYSRIYAHHIDGRTVETLTSIQLSKSKDKFLILPGMGTVSDAIIISKSGDKSFYELKGTTKIALSNFLEGAYQLLISSCNTGGQMKLIITE